MRAPISQGSVCLMGMGLLALATQSSLATLTVGTNLNVTRLAGNQTETHIANLLSGRNQVLISSPEGNLFFRLHHP